MLRASRRKTSSPYAASATKPKAAAASKKVKPRRVTQASTSSNPQLISLPSTAMTNQPESHPSTVMTAETDMAAPLLTPPGTDNASWENICTNPNPLCSVGDSLGVHIPQNLRDKIFNNEYVVLSKLLHSEPNVEPQQQLILVDGEFVVRPKQKEVKITSCEMWTTAFLIYASIYLAKYPEHIQGILKYISTIRLAAQRCQNLGWVDYDTQFRLKRARNPSMGWDQVDAELWLVYVTGTNSPQATHTQSSFPTKSRGRCFDYNYKGSCTKPYCFYTHLCMKCNQNHPSISCHVNAHQTFRQPTPSRFNHNSQQGFRQQGPNQQRPMHPNNSRFMGPGQYSY